MLDRPPHRPRILNHHPSNPPATTTVTSYKRPLAARLGIAVAGLALLTAIGWLALSDPLRQAMPFGSSAPPARLVTAFDTYPESGTPMPEFVPPPEEDSPDDSRMALAAEDETQPAPFHEKSVRLRKGDTFGGALHGLGFAARDVGNAIEALASRVSLKRLQVGETLNLKIGTPAESEAEPVLLALSMRPEPQRQLTLERDEDGGYSVEEKIFEIVSKLRRAAGPVEGSVIASAEAAGVPRPALAEMLRAFSWDVNFQHDIKVGDRFAVLIEQSWTSDGLPVDAGRVLWAELTTGGGEQTLAIYRFKPHGDSEFFYNRDGESVVKALLRTPLNMSRISSRFGLRRHPILGFTRLHAGIDFAAPPGTPILAAGDGRVMEAGAKGGYGRWVKIRHDTGLATGYAHMSRIAAGVKRSARVRQGQVIGFVGSSGLATGPHLHFELHRNGRPVSPLSVAKTAQRKRLGGADLARFKERVEEIDRERESADAIEGHPSLDDRDP